MQRRRDTSIWSPQLRFSFFLFLFHFYYFIFCYIFSLISSHRENKSNNRDTTGWRGVNRGKWRRDNDHFQQQLHPRNTTQTDKAILNVTTHQNMFLLQLKSSALGQAFPLCVHQLWCHDNGTVYTEPNGRVALIKRLIDTGTSKQL